MARSSGLISEGQAVVVETKSAWYSKINWTQVIAFVAMLGTTFGFFEWTAEQQAMILSGVITLQSMVTVVLKTFFTNTVTPASASKSSTTMEE